MKELKTRLLGIVQRDRLPEFIKVSDEENSGCFYFSLAAIYNKLNPGRVVPQTFENSALRQKNSLGVRPSDIVEVLADLCPILGLELFSVHVLPTVPYDLYTVRKMLQMPDSIPIVRTENMKFTPGDSTSGMVYWQKDPHGAHYSALHSSAVVWPDIDGKSYAVGGQIEVDHMSQLGYAPKFVLLFRNKTR